MSIKLNPYLSFKDNAREAMEFYQSVLGGTTEFHTFQEFNAVRDPSEANLIMHSMLQTADGQTFYAADTPASMDFMPGSNFSMSLSGESEDEDRLHDCFDLLCENGEVLMPFEKAMWGDMFGMCNDKFGIRWMINVAQPHPQAVSV